MILPRKIINLSSQTVHQLTAADPGKRVTDITKELIENSIDAGSTTITILIESGGYSLIKVADNGCGILKESLPDVCKYHATSKIHDASDIYKLETFGFRGTSLAHFSCISKIIISSKTENEDTATCCNYLYNVPISTDKCEMSIPKGTIVELKDLLYNFPEIRRNRKKDSIEALKVLHVVIKYALIFPNIAFTVYSNSPSKNSSKILKTLPSNEPSAILSLLRVQENDDSLQESVTFIRSNHEPIPGIAIEFYLSNFLIKFQHSTRGIYLNKRLISCPAIKSAVDEIYHQYKLINTNISNTLKPPYFIMISIPKEKIDVKIHYSSKRVNFREQKQLIEAICKIVNEQLSYFDKCKTNEKNSHGSIYNPSPSALSTLSTSTQTQPSNVQKQTLIQSGSQLKKALSSASTMTSISFKNDSNQKTNFKNLIEPNIPKASNLELHSSSSTSVSPQCRTLPRTIVHDNPRSSGSQSKNSNIPQQQQPAIKNIIQRNQHESNSSSSSPTPPRHPPRAHVTKAKILIQKADDDGKSFNLNDIQLSKQYGTSTKSYIHQPITNSPKQQQQQQQMIQNQQQQQQQRRKQIQSPHQIIANQQPQQQQPQQQRRQQTPLIQQQHTTTPQFSAMQSDLGVEVRKKKQRSSETRADSQPQQRSQQVIQPPTLHSNQQIQSQQQKSQTQQQNTPRKHHTHHHQQSPSSQSQKPPKQQQPPQQQNSNIIYQNQPVTQYQFSQPNIIYQNQPVTQYQFSQQIQQQTQQQHPLIASHSSQHMQNQSQIKISEGNSGIGIKTVSGMIGSSDGGPKTAYSSRKKSKKDNDPDYIP